MINKLDKKDANYLFEKDDWYHPMLFFSRYSVKELTLDLVKRYLEANGIDYKVDEDRTLSDDNFKIDTSTTNQYDLSRIFKSDGTHFYTDHAFNKVYSVAYMDNPPSYSNEIIINLKHSDGWLVNDDTWNHFINHRFDETEDIQELREDKITNLLDEDMNDNMSKDFNFHLIRHMRARSDYKSNPFVDSVYDFYRRKGYITRNQLDTLKKVMYWDKGYIY